MTPSIVNLSALNAKCEQIYSLVAKKSLQLDQVHHPMIATLAASANPYHPEADIIGYSR